MQPLTPSDAAEIATSLSKIADQVLAIPNSKYPQRDRRLIAADLCGTASRLTKIDWGKPLPNHGENE